MKIDFEAQYFDYNGHGDMALEVDLGLFTVYLDYKTFNSLHNDMYKSSILEIETVCLRLISDIPIYDYIPYGTGFISNFHVDSEGGYGCRIVYKEANEKDIDLHISFNRDGGLMDGYNSALNIDCLRKLVKYLIEYGREHL